VGLHFHDTYPPRLDQEDVQIVALDQDIADQKIRFWGGAKDDGQTFDQLREHVVLVRVVESFE
jgi:hypothetical protein